MALYIVPTPIGNLGDITRRAVEVLSRVDFIIAEDSRYSLKLLNHLGISKRIVSHYRPKEETQAEKIVSMLADRDAALITDSGTPALSDPGAFLIRRIREMIVRSQFKRTMPPVAKLHARTMGIDFRYLRDWNK